MLDELQGVLKQFLMVGLESPPKFVLFAAVLMEYCRELEDRGMLPALEGFADFYLSLGILAA